MFGDGRLSKSLTSNFDTNFNALLHGGVLKSASGARNYHEPQPDLPGSHTDENHKHAV